MKRVMNVVGLMAVGLVISACDLTQEHGHGHDGHDDHGEAEHEEVAKGPHGGRLLIDGDFSLELALFETGVPPEFRVWVTKGGAPIAPESVDLSITLTRLGDAKDKIAFNPQDDFLRGDTVIYEPHSFVVTVEARRGNATHRWQYDNFEGRTLIGPEIATAFGLETEIAGPATIREPITVYGPVVPDAEMVLRIDARFACTVDSVSVSVGDSVIKGQTLAKVESNESLTPYTVTSPIDGVITEQIGRAHV